MHPTSSSSLSKTMYCHLQQTRQGHIVSTLWMSISTWVSLSGARVDATDNQMVMVCHHLDRSVPEDIAFADSRIRAETVAAEDVLQDTGAISVISSDALAMGRIGEVVARTWRTAAKMRDVRGPLEGDTEGRDNERVKRYIAKYTVNPHVLSLTSS